MLANPRRAIGDRGSFEVATLGSRNRLTSHPLDVAQEASLALVAEGDRDARGAGPRGPPDAVDVGLRLHRQVVVEDVGDAVDVEASRRDVGRDKDRRTPAAEGVEGPGALPLRTVAVDRLGGDAGGVKLLDDAIGPVLGLREDERQIDRLPLEELEQQAGLAGLEDEVEPLVMRSTVVDSGVTETLTGFESSCEARRSISVGMVAEKSMVRRRAGIAAAMRRIGSMKPMSSMRSASSRTKHSIAERSTSPCPIRSRRRPCVATRMSTPREIAATCGPCPTPPKTTVPRSGVFFP